MMELYGWPWTNTCIGGKGRMIISPAAIIISWEYNSSSSSSSSSSAYLGLVKGHIDGWDEQPWYPTMYYY